MPCLPHLQILPPFYSLLLDTYIKRLPATLRALHMAFPIGFKRSQFSYSAYARRQQRLWVICCSFCYLLVLWIQSSTSAIHTKNFPEPSYAMPTEQAYDNISIMQICNSSHKARNSHNSRHCKQISHGRMVQCCICEIWYHEKCIRVPRNIWQDSSVKSPCVLSANQV